MSEMQLSCRELHSTNPRGWKFEVVEENGDILSWTSACVGPPPLTSILRPVLVLAWVQRAVYLAVGELPPNWKLVRFPIYLTSRHHTRPRRQARICFNHELRYLYNTRLLFD